MSGDLEERFDAAMEGLYRRTLKEVGRKGTYFHRMLDEHRGVVTAKILINSSKVSDGYTALFSLERLDLTVEALIYDNEE